VTNLFSLAAAFTILGGVFVVIISRYGIDMQRCVERRFPLGAEGKR
jgi:hypothetical protein